MMKLSDGRLKAQMSVVFLILGHDYSDHDYDYTGSKRERNMRER